MEATTDVEKELVSIWQEILQVDRVGIQDNFFDLGGDSIRAIQIGVKMLEMGLNITPNEIFRYPTIVQIIEEVDSQLMSSESELDEFEDDDFDFGIGSGDLDKLSSML